MTLREKRKSNFDLLGSILDDPILHDMFREFTNEKHAEEILVFYLEVKQYRETEEYEKRYIHAKKIYDYFLKVCWIFMYFHSFFLFFLFNFFIFLY